MGLSDYLENETSIEQYTDKQRREEEKWHFQLGKMGKKSQQIGFAESVMNNNVVNGPDLMKSIYRKDLFDLIQVFFVVIFRTKYLISFFSALWSMHLTW